MISETTRLKNGVVVATAEMPHMESACIGIWAMTGARHEPARLNGVSHFLEHLVFKGTRRRKATEIMREVEGIGGSVNAYTELDHTVYYAKAAAGKLGQVADVLVDLYAGAVMAGDEVEREREVIGEEIVMYEENPGQHIDDVLSEAAWPGSALGRPVTGTESSLGKIRRADLVEWRNAHYVGGNTVVAVAGRVEHAEVVKLLRPMLRRLRAGKRSRARVFPVAKRSAGPRVVHAVRDIEQSHVCLGFHAPGALDGSRYAMKVLNVLMGENMSSRLFQRLREERGLCYSVQTDVTALRDTGLFTVYAGVDPADLVGAVRLTLRELVKMGKRGPTRRELQEAIDYSIGMMRLSLESSTQQMTWLGEGLVTHGEVGDPEVVCERLAAVTVGEVRDLAARVFRAAGGCIGVVGPEVGGGVLESRLAAMG